MLLTIKDIREVFEKTLSMFYADADFAVASTKVMNKTKDFRIEFRIYDAEFWMCIDPSIGMVHIGTRSLGGPDRLDTINIWYSDWLFDYYKDKFEFGWRTDLEQFFDAFRENLLEKVKETQKTTAASVYGSSTAKPAETKSVMAQCIDAVIDAVYGNSTETKSKEVKASIFNGLKDGEDEYI